jgi:hypothetical protein
VCRIVTINLISTVPSDSDDDFKKMKIETIDLSDSSDDFEKCKKLKKKLDLLKDVQALDTENILGQFFFSKIWSIRI